MFSFSKSSLTPILQYILGIFIFAIAATIIKYLGKNIHTAEILFLRNFFIFIGCCVWLIWTKKTFILRTEKIYLHICRSVFGILGMGGMFVAYIYLPMANAAILLFTAPIFIAILSLFFTKDKVEWGKWIAIFLGFLGVIIVNNPSDLSFGIGEIAAIIGAFFQACAMLTLRKLGQTQSNMTILFYFHFFASIISGGACLYFPFKFDLSIFILMIGVAFLGFSAQLMLTISHRKAPAALLAPFTYTNLIWTSLIGFFLYHEIPSERLWIGGSIIILAGLFLIFSQYQQSKKKI